MPSANPLSIVVNVESAPRAQPGDPVQTPFSYRARSLELTTSWGLQPGTALLELVSGAAIPVIQPSAWVSIQAGGHIFIGIVNEATAKLGSDGSAVLKQFEDLRVFLQWDLVYALFNQRENKLVNGQFIRRYWHILPRDFAAGRRTYTNAPYSAAQVLDFMFNGPTVEAPWIRFYHPILNGPIYNVDCRGGKPLGTAITEISERMGAVFTLVEPSGTVKPYTLTWTLKGVGAVPGFGAGDPPFPANSENRRSGFTMSGNPSRIRILGGRSVYQVLNLELEPDWARAWEQYFDIEKFADKIFDTLTTEAPIGGIPAGTPYNAVPGDLEWVIGKQLAKARALTITVGQFAQLAGAQFLDHRKFDGRSRLGMPAALYIKTILFRAFRPDFNWRLLNQYGATVDVLSLNIQERGLVEVSHDPITGYMTWSVDVISATNGYAIARGYQIGMDLYKTLHPDRFQTAEWISGQNIWQHCEFHVDDSGDGNQFILFDEPVIVSADLILLESGVDPDGYPVLNADATITVPAVVAALTFAAEPFSYIAGGGTKDGVENVDGLNGEFVLEQVPGFLGGQGTITELPYADGETANQKAQVIAGTLLNRQFYYATGGYQVQGSNQTQISAVIDRVTLRVSAEGMTEDVDFTNERARNVGPDGSLAVIPERDFDRRAQLQPLLPGQRELKVQANQQELLAAGMKQKPQFMKFLVDAFHDAYGYDSSPSVLHIDPTQTVGQSLTIGTPLWKNSGDKVPSNPGPDTNLDQPVFVGVTTMHNQRDNENLRVTSGGVDGVVFAKVKGPVKVDDPVGFDSTNGVADAFLVGNPNPAIGTALEAITGASVKLMRVRMGVGGGRSVTKLFRFVQMFSDYMVCEDFQSPAMPKPLVQIARPWKHRNSRTSEVIQGTTWSLIYPQNTSTGSPPSVTWNALAFISRKKSNSPYFENQRIDPPYLTTDIIRATQMDDPIPGVVSVGPVGGDNLNAAGTPIVWLDDNYEGHAWCVTPDGNP